MRVDPKFRVRQYEYDANGRQRWTAKLNETEVATALYDGAGQRVETSAGGETRQIIYDAFGQMVAEYNEGVWARDYIYRGGQVIATMEAAGSTVRYVISDLQGSARVTMDASGGILARHDYLPFGEEIESGTGLRTTAQGYGAADERRQKYALLERDEETGQDHAWWRKYENLAGRWTTPDPYKGSMSIGDPQSMNRYAYVGNDPVNFVDPSGLLITMVCGYHHDNEAGWMSGCIIIATFFSTPVLPVDREPKGLSRRKPQKTEGTPVSDCVKKLLEGIINQDALNDARIIPDGISRAIKGYDGDTDAITLPGNVIWFKKGKYDPHSAAGIALIAHELVHVEQYKEKGTLGFLGEYGKQYAQNRWDGDSPYDAYRNTDIEDEAFAAQKAVEDYLNKKFKGRDPCPRE